jgi:hypothetical protein
MNDQNVLLKIRQMAGALCNPTRGITGLGESTVSFIISNTKYSRDKSKIFIYRCKILKTKKELKLFVNDKPTSSDEEDRIYCLLLEYKNSKTIKRR